MILFIIYGDFAFLPEDQIDELLTKLNGKKIFIFGNHDKGMRSDCIRKHFEVMTTYLEVYHNKQLICMMHYPLGEFNKCHHGAFHIHGHCHGNYKPPVPCRIMDVGVPCINYTPISLDAIIAKLSPMPFLKHH